jgi:hypothetical protein
VSRRVGAVGVPPAVVAGCLLLGGCALLGGGAPSGGAGSVTGPTGLGAVVASARLEGRVPPTPAGPGGGARTTGPGLTLAPPAAGSHATPATPSPECTGSLGQVPLLRPGAVPGRGSVAVSFVHPGDPRVTVYRAAAVQQLPVVPTLAPLSWQDAPSPGGCAMVRLTLGGLASGRSYVVWLDAVVTDVATGTAHEIMLGRSQPVTVA